jgi:hypothetical protein
LIVQLKNAELKAHNAEASYQELETRIESIVQENEDLNKRLEMEALER